MMKHLGRACLSLLGAVWVMGGVGVAAQEPETPLPEPVDSRLPPDGTRPDATMSEEVLPWDLTEQEVKQNNANACCYIKCRGKLWWGPAPAAKYGNCSILGNYLCLNERLKLEQILQTDCET